MAKIKFPSFEFAYKSILLILLMLNPFLILAQANKKGKTPPDQKETSTKVIEEEEKFYLDLKGTVFQTKGKADEKEKEEKNNLDSALIKVYEGKEKINEIYTNKKGKCNLRLELDKKYKIEVTKKGFVTKFFEVDTKVPANKISMFSFNFDIDLFAEIKGLDVTVLKKPIAKVDYDIIEDHFEYDDDYTNRINFDLKKMYKNYYLLQETAKDTTLKTENKQDPKKQAPKKTNGTTPNKKATTTNKTKK
jgi:hypothetical protein